MTASFSYDASDQAFFKFKVTFKLKLKVCRSYFSLIVLL